MKPTAFYVLPAILLVALIACSNTDDPIIDEDLLGVVWRIDSLQTIDEKIYPDRYWPMTIQLDQDMTIKVQTSCNEYEGVYEVTKKGKILIDVHAVTEDTCIGLAFIDDAFMLTLGNVTGYSVNGGRMNLCNSDHSYVIKLSVGLVDEDLLNVLWQADSLQTPQEKIVTGDTSMTIQFSDRLLVWGFDACHGYYGVYSNPEKGALAIRILSITDNACARRNEFLGFCFNTVLFNATAYDLKGNSFIIYDDERRYVLYFSAK